MIVFRFLLFLLRGLYLFGRVPRVIKRPTRSRDGQLTNVTKPVTDQMCPKFVFGNFTSPTQGKNFMCLVPSFIAPCSQNSLELHLELCVWQWVVLCPNKKWTLLRHFQLETLNKPKTPPALLSPMSRGLFESIFLEHHVILLCNFCLPFLFKLIIV
jgi:hypothetical protein